MGCRSGRSGASPSWVSILDLITPWTHAAASQDARELRHFRDRHAVPLEMIRRQRAPLLSELPAPSTWKAAAARAADGDQLDAIRATRDRMVEAGFREPAQIVLAASSASGPIAEVIPGGSSTVALFLDRHPIAGPGRAPDLAAEIVAAFAGAIAIITRWTDPRRDNPIARIARQGPWDKWQAAREVPLAEWIYAAGIGVHAAIAFGADNGDPTTDALGYGRSMLRPYSGTHANAEFRRFRAAEHELQSHLDADLDHSGAGLLIRWLDDDAPPAMRRCADGFVVPPGAGRYLGWRMLEERVARVGVLEAAGMEA